MKAAVLVAGVLLTGLEDLGLPHWRVHSFVLQKYPHRTLLFPQTKPSSLSILDRQDGIAQRHRRLTTKVNEEEEPVKLSLLDHFRKAGRKFRSKPGTYMIIPVIAALVGWVTNWLAVQMIFYPIKFRGIPLWIKDEVPLGFLGWQGIVVRA